MTTTASTKAEKVRLAYRFLCEREQGGVAFSVDELVAASGWREATVATYLKKKWAQLVTRGASGLRVAGVGTYTEDEFVRLMSQKDEVSADPKRPNLVPQVEALVRKSRESALLALQIYNNPATVFKTEGYAVLMVIAWTSLMHAIFEKRGVPYFYLEPDGITPKLVDGDKKAWELEHCMKQFWGAADHSVRRNLDFFIRLRNRVEHRYVPAIDPHVAGECQALLFNFDAMLVEQFGNYFAVRETLALALQTGSVRDAGQSEAVRKLQAQNFDAVKEFVDAYRSGLPTSISDDPKFSFRVYLVPKTGNHPGSSDLAVEFVKYDPAQPELMSGLQKQIALIKEKQVPVANANLLAPAQVVALVGKAIGRPFNMHHHTLAWARYKVRKQKFEPSACNTKFCVPDPRHKDYGYTKEWVDLLISKLSDHAEYHALVMTKAALP